MQSIPVRSKIIHILDRHVKIHMHYQCSQILVRGLFSFSDKHGNVKGTFLRNCSKVRVTFNQQFHPHLFTLQLHLHILYVKEKLLNHYQRSSFFASFPQLKVMHHHYFMSAC